MNTAYKKQLKLSEKTESELLRKIIRSKIGPYLILLLVSRSALILTIALDQRAYLKNVFPKKLATEKLSASQEIDLSYNEEATNLPNED